MPMKFYMAPEYLHGSTNEYDYITDMGIDKYEKENSQCKDRRDEDKLYSWTKVLARGGRADSRKQHASCSA